MRSSNKKFVKNILKKLETIIYSSSCNVFCETIAFVYYIFVLKCKYCMPYMREM